MSGIEPGQDRRKVQAELVRVLLDGPGIAVFKGAFDVAVVDRATAVFEAIIVDQKARGAVAGDHFAKPGANDRVWGALDKLALRAPEVFVDYYGNSILALICEAWLGPGYQMTSQVNVVNPGGQAQVAHTDYHLGFMSVEQAQAYPMHVHALSPALTLQGAVAHMRCPSRPGRRCTCRTRSSTTAVTSPATSASSSTTSTSTTCSSRSTRATPCSSIRACTTAPAPTARRDVRRMANLLQVSSPFGRAMESVDRVAISKALFPVLRERRAAGASDAFLRCVVAASAEGYAFPTNLDRDQPVGDLAPESQAGLVWRALTEGWDENTLATELDAHRERHQAAGHRSSL